VKTSFLELLWQLSRQNKTIPLTLEQRFCLVKSLLHLRLKEFDFDAVGFSELSLPGGYIRNKNEVLQMIRELWSELAEKCPNLLKIIERRTFVVDDNSINHKLFTFSKLVCLETGFIFDRGTFIPNIN